MTFDEKLELPRTEDYDDIAAEYGFTRQPNPRGRMYKKLTESNDILYVWNCTHQGHLSWATAELVDGHYRNHKWTDEYELKGFRTAVSRWGK